MQEGNEETVNVSLQLPKKDWELFKIACEKCGKRYEEVLCELTVKWAEDIMKSELLPP